MNVERLNLMVTMLQEVVDGTWKPTNPIQVKFESWEDSEDKNRSAFNLDHWVRKTSKPCGYSACAVGHALLDKRFTVLGLVPELEEKGTAYPVFEGETCMEGIEDFFDITNGTAQNLFLPSDYPVHLKDKMLATQVLRRIKKLLEVGEEKYQNILVNCNKSLHWEEGYWTSEDRLISPQGRVYNYKYRG